MKSLPMIWHHVVNDKYTVKILSICVAFLETWTLTTQCISVLTDLANWGPSGPDRTTKIFRTGPNGPGPDLPEKETDKMVQKTCQNLTMLNAHVWFVFESLLLSFYKVWIILKS